MAKGERKSKARKTTPLTVAELQALVRGAGLRSTTPRIAVLEHFHAHPGPTSHAEVFEALGDRGFDRASIYRVLTDLAEAKLLTRTDLGDHVWRFELDTGGRRGPHAEAHPHFVCVDCGEVSCLPGLSLKVEGKAKAPASVTKQKVSVQLKGLCDDCA
jgi:Fur family transcriptional regulator, ferric uptake regulator